MLNLRTIISKIALANENIDKGKSILGAPLKLDKKETKNSRAKKGNTQKSKWLAIGHTRSNCYKWLATQQSNSMISSGNQNQFPSFFAPLEDLLKLEWFQFFPLITRSRVCKTERFFQGEEGKRF